MSVEKPFTIFSEHIADIDREITRTETLVKVLRMQRDMLANQERLMVAYRQVIIDNQQ